MKRQGEAGKFVILENIAKACRFKPKCVCVIQRNFQNTVFKLIDKIIKRLKGREQVKAFKCVAMPKGTDQSFKRGSMRLNKKRSMRFALVGSKWENSRNF